MKVRLLSSTNGLKSASLKRLAVALSQEFGYKVWRSSKSKPKRKEFRYADAVNKLQQYQWFQQQGLSALEFTTSTQEAYKWWHDEGVTVFGRRLLNASCGDGIVVFTAIKDGGEEGPCPDNECPVYTKYKPKKREWRVHVFKDKVVTIVEKRRKKDYQGDKTDAKVRNLKNGYVFCQAVELDDALRSRIHDMALRASKVCASDFKGVDIAYNEKRDDVFVIEVNSAPGIEGSNVDKYVQVIKQYA
jgi:hypothetical protein